MAPSALFLGLLLRGRVGRLPDGHRRQSRPAGGGANPNLALLAALGPCSALTANTFISINELTTVAAVNALAPYMSSLSALGSTPAHAAALDAAFTQATSLWTQRPASRQAATSPPT